MESRGLLRPFFPSTLRDHESSVLRQFGSVGACVALSTRGCTVVGFILPSSSVCALPCMFGGKLLFARFRLCKELVVISMTFRKKCRKEAICNRKLLFKILPISTRCLARQSIWRQLMSQATSQASQFSSSRLRTSYIITS